MRALKLALLVCILLLSITPVFAAKPGSTADILARLGGYPCPDSDFTCVKLTVPLNHFAVDRGRTIDVVFGVLPATGERKGMFVTATGGPGSSGLASADSYTAAFDPSIPEHFDIVFFDQRGVGQSGDLECPNAAVTYYQQDARADTPAEEANLIDQAKTFAQDCVNEIGIDPGFLPFYGTNQAVEDLDLFRQAIGDDKIWLYGESYGTQYAQEYAAAHPDHLAALILDGTVDLTLSGTDFLAGQAQAFNDVLVQTLQACNDNSSCSGDVDGGDALAVYDDLAAELDTSPVSFDFPLPSGGKAHRSFTRADLEGGVIGFLYSEGSRLILQRAIASASHGDLVPLARIAYNSLEIDPETLEPAPDPTFSDALFYTVECQDYNYFSGTPDQRAAAYIRAGDATDQSIPRLSDIFYGDLPCAFWPSAPEPDRPAPLTAAGIPTIVLGATADPATPLQNGEDVFSRLSDGYLIVTDGGPHVTFGWGNACPDDIVTAFLVDDQMPARRQTGCDGVIAYDYLPNPPASAADYADPLDALDTAYLSLYYLPEYYYWDTSTTTSIGCPSGGTLTFAAANSGAALTFDHCAFSDGFAMTGTGEDNFFDDGSTHIKVSVTGLESGNLTYRYSSDGSVRVTGTYGGQTIDLSQ